MKGDPIDKWIHQLMDADLSPEQRSGLEQRLRSSPEAATDLDKEQIIRKYLREIGKESVLPDRPDFMWSQVKRQIQQSTPERKSSSSRFSIFAFPYLPWAFASLVLIAGAAYWFSNTSSERVKIQQLVMNRAAHQGYGEISGVETFSSDVSATSYESRSGNATVVWVNGFDRETSPSKFGEIWEIHSYKPDIIATSYESSSGNATVIWVSGTDSDDSGKTAVF